MSNTNVNSQYEYTNEMLGSFSGGTWQAAYGNAPHPVAFVGTGDTVTDLSAITLGGFGGLNN